MLLHIHLIPQIRLRKHRQRIPRHPPVAQRRPRPPHKVRHRLELAPRDALQRLARLERHAVARDLDLHRLARPRLDVQPGRGVGRRGELGERRQRGGHLGVLARLEGWARYQGGGLGLVDEHGGRQARQAAVVEVGRAPVVAVAVGGLAGAELDGGGGGGFLGEVVQQAGFGGGGCAHDVLEVAGGVVGDLLLGEPVAGAGHEHGDVDDQAAEVLERLLEPREGGLAGPDVGGEVLGEVVGVELGRRRGAGQGWVDVEGAVGVEGALEGVDLAVLEGFLAEGPAGEVLGLFVFEFVWFV